MANRFHPPRFTALTSTGAVGAGYKLNFYVTGTTTPLDTYSDEGRTSANANPVVADSAGRFGEIFLQPRDYKVVFTTDADVTIWTADPVQSDARNEFNATTAPGVSDDVDQGYDEGSFWIDRTNDRAYVCVDSSNGAAVWKEIGPSGVSNYVAGAGAANAYTAAPDPAWTSYAAGNLIRIKIGAGHTNTGASTLNVSSLGVKNIKQLDSSTDPTSGSIVAGEVHSFLYDGTNFLHLSGNANNFVQRAYTSTASATTHTTTVPNDDTIPQNTEGEEILTLAITPTNTANRLRIKFRCPVFGHSTTNTVMFALFQDSTADALAVSTLYNGTADRMNAINFVHEMAAGTTSSTTFKIRAGGDAGTLTINGVGGARRFGGVATASLTIDEVKA